jgi:hypothetical protein
MGRDSIPTKKKKGVYCGRLSFLWIIFKEREVIQDNKEEYYLHL